MDLQLACFHLDVTPPMGHSLCGGWIPPASGVDDPLQAIGLVLLGSGAPIVICAVDWTGLCNEAHLRWRQVLAEAAHTTPERVAVQCVHQHDAPFVCLETERIVAEQGDLPHNVDVQFFERVLARARRAVETALRQPRRVTHVAHGQARIEKVASNRRILGPDGKVQHMRSVAPSSNDIRHLPVGLIDPWLKTVGFYDGPDKLAALHYYAVHPISYCCQEGRVSSEFVGLARKRRQKEEPGCTHLYFNGCGGNLNTGKYNCSDDRENRARLTERIYRGIVTSEAQLKPAPIETLSWRSVDILPPARDSLSAEELQRQIANKKSRVVARNRPAFALAWLRRLEQKLPLTLSALHVNDVSLLHLPAECFVEYQLQVQKLQPDRFVATAAYGDGGPWYIPTAGAYEQGGYEVRVALCGPEIEQLMTGAMQELLVR